MCTTYDTHTLFRLGVFVSDIDTTPTLMIILNYIIFSIIIGVDVSVSILYLMSVSVFHSVMFS
jgi:hypothetical protein